MRNRIACLALTVALPGLLAACGPVPTLTDTAQLAAQANMVRLEGTSVSNPIAAGITACVLSNATQTEVNALAVAQSRAEMDAIVAPILDRPGYDACLGLGAS